MYQKPYTCIEINVLLHFFALKALTLRHTDPAPRGGHSGAVPPQMTACAPPNKNCAPPNENCAPPNKDCAPKKLTGWGILECKSRPKTPKLVFSTLKITSKKLFFRNFCGLTPDFIKLLGRRLFLFFFGLHFRTREKSQEF